MLTMLKSNFVLALFIACLASFSAQAQTFEAPPMNPPISESAILSLKPGMPLQAVKPILRPLTGNVITQNDYEIVCFESPTLSVSTMYQKGRLILVTVVENMGPGKSPVHRADLSWNSPRL